MCGRFTRASEVRAFTDLVAGLTYVDTQSIPRYNITPSQQAWIARETTKHRELVPLRWGLVPHWAPDTKIGYKMINARSETVATKPAFRDSFKYRRCLVAADGWYEWKVTPTGKVPMFIHQVTDDGEIAPFFFAGLWVTWRDKTKSDAEPLDTFTILTKNAAASVRDVHDRMPVVIAPSHYEAWLDPEQKDVATVSKMIDDAQTEFVHYPVSTQVSNARNDSADLITPL